MTIVAVLDADVLFPMVLRDTLLRVAAAGAFRAHWSERIMGEVLRNLIEEHRVTSDKAKRLADMMNKAFPEAVVRDWESLEATMTNHPKDRHVAAAAAKANATFIVTSNAKDFRSLPQGIASINPDKFLVVLFDADPATVRAAIEKQAAGYRNPPATPESLIQWLGDVTPTFAARLSSVLDKDRNSS